MTTIRYMERTRDYYRAQGFSQDYSWAENIEIPFFRASKPTSQWCATIVTTAVTEPDIPKPIREAKSYAFADLPEALDNSETSWDRETTHTDDRESYFPMSSLQSLVSAGRLGRMATRYHFVPTEYSQRATNEVDAPRIVQHCIEDEVDVAFLVPL